MGDVYKVNLTWTSPMVTYEPSGAWRQAATIYNESTATFQFYGNGLKWFGSTNSTDYYTITLDNVLQTVIPRKYNTTEEGPSNVWCNYTIPWECHVLAEFDGLDPTAEHTVQLSTAFNETSLGKESINLLALQVSYDTSKPEETMIQDYKVDMDNERLVFAGDWANITYDPNEYKLSKTPGSTISLQFKGYSVSVWGTNDISTSPYDISLDGQTESFSFPEISTTDKEVLLWYKSGLDQDSQHTVVVTNQGTDGLIVGSIKYTRLVDPSNRDDGSDNTSPQGSTKLSGGAIAGTTIGALFLFFLLSYWMYRRMLRKRAKDPRVAKGQGASRLSLRGLLGGSSSLGQISPWEDPRSVEAPHQQRVMVQRPYQQGEIPTDQPPPFEQHQPLNPIVTAVVTAAQPTSNPSPTTPTSTHQAVRKERLTLQPTTSSTSNRASAAVPNNNGPAVVIVDTDNVPADNLAQRERGSVSSASGQRNEGVIAQRKPSLYPSSSTSSNNNSGNMGGQTTPRSPVSPASEGHPHDNEVVVAVGRQSPEGNHMLSPTTASSPHSGGDASDNSRRNTHHTITTVNTASPTRRNSNIGNPTTTPLAEDNGIVTGDQEVQMDRPATPPPAYEGPSPQEPAGTSSSTAAQRRREARDRKAAASEPRTLGVTND